jgi:DNA polymerase III epsilon subunit
MPAKAGIRDYLKCDGNRIMKTSHRHVVLDVETTGLSLRYGHRVIEVGAIAVEGGKPVGEFTTLINPGVTIPREASKIHGITISMLSGQPMPEEILPRVSEFIQDSVLVAHHAVFDISFLRREFERIKLGFPHHYVCTLEMSKRCFPHLANYKLETVYRHIFGNYPEGGQTHRALADARMTAAIWLAMKV